MLYVGKTVCYVHLSVYINSSKAGVQNSDGSPKKCYWKICGSGLAIHILVVLSKASQMHIILGFAGKIKSF